MCNTSRDVSACEIMLLICAKIAWFCNKVLLTGFNICDGVLVGFCSAGMKMRLCVGWFYSCLTLAVPPQIRSDIYLFSVYTLVPQDRAHCLDESLCSSHCCESCQSWKWHKAYIALSGRNWKWLFYIGRCHNNWLTNVTLMPKKGDYHLYNCLITSF